MKKIIPVFLLFLIQLFSSCANSENREYSQEEIAAESARLQEFFEREFQEDLGRSPMLQTKLGIKTDYGKWDNFSHLQYAKELEEAKSRLSFLKDSVEQAALDEETLLSYKLYRQQMENEIEEYDFRFYNYPVNQIYGAHTALASFLINLHQVENLEDAEAYISRLNGIPRVLEEVKEGIKLREINQVIPPSFVLDLSIETSRNIITGRPFEKSAEPSVLLSDFQKKVEALEISVQKREELLKQAEKALVTSVGPAYKNLIATLEDQRQRATTDHGVWHLPKGKEYYSLILNRTTTANLGAEEIHQYGLNEVARIQKQMEEEKNKLGFEGSLEEFFEYLRTDEKFYFSEDSTGRKAYLAEANEIMESVKGRMDELLPVRPNADILLKAVEAYREKSAGEAFYEPPALDGARPGIFFVNLYDMQAMPKYQMEALVYHNAFPGHHMQMSLAQEAEALPMFRRISYYPAYVEGWGLYSELVSREIGLYKDPYSNLGRLAVELGSSIALVVDTGIHARKWTREQGIEYYMQNSPYTEGDAIKMVERQIVLPGYAAAHKIGMNRILLLRQRAKDSLGKDFDLRKFHEVILKDGALPLNILEKKVEEWLRETQTENPMADNT